MLAHSHTKLPNDVEQVITVLLERLRTEQQFLNIPYYTWWFEYKSLEVFESHNSSFSRGLWKPYSWLVEHASPEFLTRLGRHDILVEELTEACGELQRCLESSDELRGMLDQYTRPAILAELGTSLAELFGARFPEVYCSYVAQLIVNQTPPDCSPLYTIRPLWLLHGDKFLSLRSSKSFAEVANAIETKADELLETIKALEQDLGGYASQ